MKHFNRVWLTITLCGALSVRALADTQTFAPIADATIFNFFGCPPAPNGECGSGLGDRLYFGDTVSFGERRGLLRFDLTSIPAGSTITAATLSLTLVRARADNSTVSVRRLLQPWSEGPSIFTRGSGVPALPGDVTWLTRTFATTPAQPWITPGGDFVPTISSSQVVGGVVFPVLSVPYAFVGTQLAVDVQNWVNQPSTNYGWIILGSVGASGQSVAKAFASREHLVPSERPSLTVTFTPTAPISEDIPIPAWALGALGAALAAAQARNRSARRQRLSHE